MPYFRCPNCRVLVHLVAGNSAQATCSRCQVPLRQDAGPPPGEQLLGLARVRDLAAGSGGGERP
jgi:uncharacterized paraquat-inducible protein A